MSVAVPLVFAGVVVVRYLFWCITNFYLYVCSVRLCVALFTIVIDIVIYMLRCCSLRALPLPFVLCCLLFVVCC